MKTLTLLLAFAISSQDAALVLTAVVSDTIVVTKSDSIAPTYRKGRLYSPPSDGVATAAFVAGLLAFGSLLSGVFIPFLVLVTASVVLGITGLVRIRKSHGQKGGRLLAWLAIITGVFWLTVLMLFLTRVWVLP